MIEANPLAVGHESARQHRMQCTEVEAVRMLAHLAQRQPSPVTQTPWARPQRRVDESARQEASTCRIKGASAPRAHGRCLDPPQQLPQDVGVCARVGLRLDHALAPAHVIAHAHRREDQVEFLAL